MSERGPAYWTVRVLQAGAAFAGGLCLSAIALHAIGSDVADNAALLGVLALIATPPLSLAATAIEAWGRERQVALLAIVVLGVLTVASGLALLLGR